MQRIDENTYIDDTLVTCSDYQLFIDEMCEQGNYYQPDHWTSYQFPKGQAREPILGVRFSDAEAFCKWVTVRESGDWSFRIPTAKEAEQYSLIKAPQFNIGYWTYKGGDQISILEGFYEGKFIWASPNPRNPRNLDFTNYLIYTNKISVDNPLDINPNNYFTGILPPLFPVKDIIEPRDIVVAQYYERDDELNLEFTLDINLAANRDLKGVRNLDCILKRAITRVHNRDIAFMSTFSKTDDHENNSAMTEQNFIVDIFTLCKRISGHSPAFEGIRLVKERIDKHPPVIKKRRMVLEESGSSNAAH